MVSSTRGKRARKVGRNSGTTDGERVGITPNRYGPEGSPCATTT